MGEARGAIEAAATWAEPEQRALAAIRSAGRVLRLRRPPARSGAPRPPGRPAGPGAWVAAPVGWRRLGKLSKGVRLVRRRPVLACGCSPVCCLLRGGLLG